MRRARSTHAAAFSLANRRYAEFLAALTAHPLVDDIIGSTFAHKIVDTHRQVAFLQEETNRVVINRFLEPIQSRIAAEVVKAKETKQLCYGALRDRNQMAAKVDSLSASRKADELITVRMVRAYDLVGACVAPRVRGAVFYPPAPHGRAHPAHQGRRRARRVRGAATLGV